MWPCTGWFRKWCVVRVRENAEWKKTSGKCHGMGSLRELFRSQERLRKRAQRGDDRLCLCECCMQRRGRRSLVGEASLLDGVRGLFRGPLYLGSSYCVVCRGRLRGVVPGVINWG